MEIIVRNNKNFKKILIELILWFYNMISQAAKESCYTMQMS